jgi:cell division protein FtsW
MQRLISFLNPWADPFDSGFQLTQSLIAIGTGGWFGTGLGGSVQKLFYLPEAHTDFLFAVLSEELGFVGVSVVVSLFAILFYRIVKIAAQAEASGNYFAAYMAYGIGIWISAQAIINMGVNVGLLPTKGLTLPLMSYGGSSLIVCCAAIGLLMRISYETSLVTKQASRNSANRTSKKASGAVTRRKQSRRQPSLSAANASAQKVRAAGRIPKQGALL